MNIPFSDEFAVRILVVLVMLQIDRFLTQEKHPKSNNFGNLFKLLCGDKSNYRTLNFIDNKFLVKSGIDPAIMIDHYWKKLWTIWKDIKKDYKEVYWKFTQSG